MTTLRRLAVYLLTFFLLVGLGASGFDGLWRWIDHRVYQSLYVDVSNVELMHDLTVVDIPYKADRADPTEYRERIADLMQTIARRPDEPEAVVLDFDFANDSRGLAGLRQGMQALRDRGIEVFSVLNLKDFGRDLERVFLEHAADLYPSQQYYGHTVFYVEGDLLTYETELEVRQASGNVRFVEALPLRVARELNPNHRVEPGQYVIPLGPEGVFEERTLAFRHEAGRTEGGSFYASREAFDPTPLPTLDDRILLVGSVEEDCIDCPRRGPELVAWALSDQRAGLATARQPLDDELLGVAQAVAFACLAAAIYALLFQYVKGLQTRPIVIAALSVAAAVGLAIAFGAAVLGRGLVPPVGLTLFAIVVAGVLAWRYAYKFLVTGVADGDGHYDVFISYSRSQSEWVERQLYEPLAALRKPDDEPLEIFYDRESIGIGEAFTSKYMWGIVRSRVFVAVFSEDYYGKHHCKNEMDLAFHRSLGQKLEIIPIVLENGVVPDIYKQLNYERVTSNPEFFDVIAAKVLTQEKAVEAS